MGHYPKRAKSLDSAAGAAVAQPRGPIPGVGWYAVVRSPDGNLFGLMQDDPNAK